MGLGKGLGVFVGFLVGVGTTASRVGGGEVAVKVGAGVRVGVGEANKLVGDGVNVVAARVPGVPVVVTTEAAIVLEADTSGSAELVAVGVAVGVGVSVAGLITGFISRSVCPITSWANRR